MDKISKARQILGNKYDEKVKQLHIFGELASELPKEDLLIIIEWMREKEVRHNEEMLKKDLASIKLMKGGR